MLIISRRERSPNAAASSGLRAQALAPLAAVFLAAAFGLSPNKAVAVQRETAGKPEISALAARLEREGDRVRLLIELSAPVPVSAYTVAGPDRVIVDLPEVAFLIDPGVGRAPGAGRGLDALIKSYRFGLFAPGRSRLVVDLARPAKILRASSENKSEGARLDIELAPTDAASFAAAAEQARAPPEAPAPPPAPPIQAENHAANQGKPVVVIDPGHGGVDMGATGKHGELEKAIVFDFARTLAARIEAKGRLRAVLTRAEDVFVSLDERVRFAKRNNASLFLSIHADTLGEPHVEGATVYTVSAKASDAEAAKTAEKENYADQAAGLARLERKEEAEEIGDILFDLTRRETRAFGRQFAQTLVARWKEAGSLNKNPSRSAGFVVLKAHDVPSVLLELGYLSSAKDLANLTSPQWRERAAETTALAIESFFTAREQTASVPEKVPARAATAAERPQ
jgi:N-acetylmuramoyl-L-alanine amidase